MATFIDWIHKTVALKIASVDEAIKAEVTQVDSNGLWLKGADLSMNYVKKRSQDAQAVVLSDPIFFVPHSQIQWVMSADPKSQV
jgi:hypothetical protein